MSLTQPRTVQILLQQVLARVAREVSQVALQ